MDLEKTKERFDLLRQMTTLVAGNLHFGFTEGVHETLQNLLEGEVQRIDDLPDDQTTSKIEKVMAKEDWDQLDEEDWRSVLQLLYLEAERQDQIQPNHQMTPEGIASLIGYLATRFVSYNGQNKKEALHLVDLAFGTGNLYEIVAKTLEDRGYKVVGSGIDNDDLILAIGEKMMLLEKRAVNLYLQDALQDLYIDPADFVISDLPIGYYPNDGIAESYEAATNKNNKQEHAYAHYLFVEQAIHYLKPNGWGIFIVPANLFQDEKAPILLQAIQKEGYFQSFLQLPMSFFRSLKARKALLIVQKRGDQAKQAEQVLVGDIPSFKEKQAMQKFFVRLNTWLKAFKS